MAVNFWPQSGRTQLLFLTLTLIFFVVFLLILPDAEKKKKEEKKKQRQAGGRMKKKFCLCLCLCLYLALALAYLGTCRGDGPVASICGGNGNYSKGSQLEKNVLRLFSNLVNGSRQSGGYYNISAVGTGPSNRMYGLLQCRGDTSASQCYKCAQEAVTGAQQACGTALGVIIWFDHCFFRFEQTNFTGQLDLQTSRAYANVQNATDTSAFNQVLGHLFLSLQKSALASRTALRYASGSNDTFLPTIYALLQCWNDISDDDCKSCLGKLVFDMSNSWDGKQGGQELGVNCIGRYELYSFFTATPSPPSPPSPPPPPLSPPSTSPTPALPPAPRSSTEITGESGNRKLEIFLGAAIGGSTLLVVMLVSLACFLARRRPPKPSKTPFTETEVDNDNMATEDHVIVFSMEALMAATKNFHPDRKLGEGGFGVVYKGYLPDEREIAVKKLSIQYVQGKQEFLNEINVVAKFRHRNLINLIGCCMEGSDRILVYEYLPNKSLDQFLFDNKKKGYLGWQERYNIILGVARGLLYLHENRKLKIIHRDIKAGNILLDEGFNPKISDFGLARFFRENESHIQTRLAGTYGYMAPKYATEGQLSAKADVYSFGVLILEIISATKNSDFSSSRNGQNLLGWTRRLYQQRNLVEMVDDSIRASCNHKQLVRCIHVALLCTQADASLRPQMSAVQLMLLSCSVTLTNPTTNPTTPAFVNFNPRDGTHNGNSVSNRMDQSSSSTPSRITSTTPSPRAGASHADISVSEVEPR